MPRQIEDKFMLRLSNGLRDAIKIVAVRNRRSMNAEILLVLEREFGTTAGSEATNQSPAAD